MKKIFVLLLLFANSCIIAEGIYKQIYILQSAGQYIFEDTIVCVSNDTLQQMTITLKKNGELFLSENIPDFGNKGEWKVLPSDTGFFIDFYVGGKFYGSSSVCCDSNRITIYAMPAPRKERVLFKIN
jgi:hypothetical protein